MTFKEFWDHYIEAEKEPLTHQIILQIFGEPLSEQVRDEYDITDTILYLLDFYHETKNHQGILELKATLRAHNPESYAESRIFFDDALLPYLLYHQEMEGIAAVVENYIAAPLGDFDLVNRGMNRLKYTGYTALLESCIDKVYFVVEKSAGFLEGATHDLATMKVFFALERLYQNYQSERPVDDRPFVKELSPFGWNIEKSYLSILKESFTHAFEQVKSELWEKNMEDWEANEYLQNFFLQYGIGIGMPFVVSGTIWDVFFEYWEENNDIFSGEAYFDLEPKSIYSHIESKTGIILDYRFEASAILWGGGHIYDFLREIGLIGEEKYTHCTQMLTEIQRLFMHDNIHSLWQYGFISDWPAPKYKTEEEIIWEATNISHSYALRGGETYELLASDEVEKLEKKFREPYDSMLTDFDLPLIDNQSPKPLRPTTPVRNTPKIGRNEKIDVRYTDGTIKKSIKYKFVQEDIEHGRCEIIK